MPPVPSLIDGFANAQREVRFWRCADERAQAFNVAADIERLIGARKVAPQRIAVLVPSMESQSRPVAGALKERAIPHRLLGRAAFFQRAEVRDVLAWLRLLVDPGDAGAAVRALVRPPIELRQVDVARVVQIARRRKLAIVSASRSSLELPHIPPEARERIARFLDLHEDVSGAFGQLPPQAFLTHLIESLELCSGHPLTSTAEVAEREASVAALEELAAAFMSIDPACDTRELAAHLLGMAGGGSPGGPQGERSPGPPLPGEELLEEREARDRARPGEVQVMGLSATPVQQFDHIYLVGLHAARLPAGEGPEESGEAIVDAARSARDRLVLAYPAASPDGKPRVPSPMVEDARLALGAEWEDRDARAPEPQDSLRAAVHAMRKELLDGVARVGGRLGELRLDTDLDISHGVVRYLELVKLVALLERPEGQSLAEALADVNARLLAAATPLQREILETSTLDETLLAAEHEREHGAAVEGRIERGPRASPAGVAGADGLLGSIAREERSLESFLPRRGAGLLLSASDVETYRSCPLRYKFARVLKIPSEPTLNQRFGIVVHQVLERYHASGAGTLEQLMELLEVCWRRSGLGEAEHQRMLLEKARASLTLYHQALNAQGGEPVWFERSFAFELGPHRLRGRVDRVDRLQDGTYELIDYKTGRPKSEAALRDDIQLSLYALAARESWQLDASSLAYYYVLDAKKVPVPRENTDLAWLEQTVMEVGEAIMAERFDPTPSDAACSICDYRIVCPAAER